MTDSGPPTENETPQEPGQHKQPQPTPEEDLPLKPERDPDGARMLAEGCLSGAAYALLIIMALSIGLFILLIATCGGMSIGH
ncbi:MAG: hypothetical protein GC159_02200 [Phycisphaera sp.]|nr:hypothetical protein [Phycisphaera sp.]